MPENMLGDYLRQLRGNKSLREFASQCSISHTHLDSIEKGVDPRTGKKVSVSTETLRLLSEHLSVDYVHLACLAVDREHYFHSPQPVSMLCSVYGVKPSQLAKICNLDLKEAEVWAKGLHHLPEGPQTEMYPNGEMAELLSEFFEIPVNDLERGIFPPYPKDSVANRVKNLACNHDADLQLFAEKSPTLTTKDERDDSMETKLVELYHELNEEGQDKLVDYADDMVRSGKYIKTDEIIVDKEA